VIARQRCMRLPKAASGGCVLACLLAVAACGASPARSVSAAPAAVPVPAASCAAQSGFALSLVSDRGGQPTPVAAAAWFARHGGVPGIPSGGWQETGQNASGATVRSGPVTLHVLQGPDRTWQVDSGTRCS